MRALKRFLGPAIVVALMLVNVVHLAGGASHNDKVAVERAWTLPFSQVQGAVLTVLAPGGRPVIVLQTPRELALVTPEGRLARSLPAPGLTTMATGDLDGDGGDEIVLLRAGPPRLEALDGELSTLWRAALSVPSAPTRVLAKDLDGDGRAEVVTGGPSGLDAFTPGGRSLWSWRFRAPAAGEKAELRGLDDLRDGRVRRVAAARRDGALVVLDAAGRGVVETQGGEVRRLRAADADGDGRDEVLVGRDSGAYEALGEGGAVRAGTQLGESVVEIRKVDLDGRRDTPDVALGGKRGAVSVLRGNKIVLRAHMAARVSDLGGVDVDGDGRDELVVGCDDNSITVFSGTGARLASFRASGKPERVLPAGPAGGARQVLVAGASALAAYSVSRVAAPIWYSPVLALMMGLAGFAGLGLVLRRVRPPEAPRPAEGAALMEAPVVAAQSRLEALIASGHVSREQAAERLDQLARRLADARVTPEAPRSPAPPPSPSPPPPPRRSS